MAAIALSTVAGLWGDSAAQERCQRPWRFCEGESTEVRFCGSLSNRGDEYQCGERSIEKKPEEAIRALKAAIRQKKGSQSGWNTGRARLEYFPYLRLAQAYVNLDPPAWGLALQCLEKEEESASTMQPKMLEEFRQLYASAKTTVGSETLLARADQVRGWRTDSVPLTAEEFDALSRIESGSQALKAALQQNSPTASDEYDSLSEQIAELPRAVLGRVDRELDGLHRQWPDAFTPRNDRCRQPGDDADTDTTQAAINAVPACAELEVEAIRTAGRYECDQIRALVDGVNQVADGLARFGEEVSRTDMPSECGDWSRDRATIAASLENLRTASSGIRDRLDGRRGELTAQLNAKRGEQVAELQAAYDRLPEVPSDCPEEVVGTDLARSVRDLRGRVDPSAVPPGASPPASALEAVGQTDRILGQLAAAVGKANLSAVDSCPEADKAVTQFASARKAYSRTPNLADVCRKAVAVSKANRRCRSQNTEAFKAELRVLESCLEAAATWHSSTGVGLECASQARSQVAGIVRERPGSSWSDRAEQVEEEADECLTRHDQIRGDWEVSAAEKLGALSERLADLAPDPELIGPELTAVPSYSEAIARLRNACPDDAAAGAADSILTDLSSEWRGLISNPAALGTPPTATDEPQTRICRARLDKAAAGLWKAIAEQLPEAESQLDRIGPYLSLRSAWADYVNGRLDAAILTVRKAQSKGAFSENSEAAGLAHATLSYFLYLKSELAGSEQVRGILRRDALDEAHAAVERDSDLEPSEALFSDQFLAFFRESSSARRVN